MLLEETLQGNGKVLEMKIEGNTLSWTLGFRSYLKSKDSSSNFYYASIIYQDSVTVPT